MTERTAICLWFDGAAEEAANFYVSLLPDSRIVHVQPAPADYPAGKAGDVLAVEFVLAGRRYMALNGGPEFHFDEAISIQVFCDTQQEIDRLWAALSARPESEQCGWCKDRYGLSWQVVPSQLSGWLAGPRGREVMLGFMPMTKLEIAPLRAIAEGG
jgi:predicted 3-demethylubiquinone-9 3-methyltransferase (glyoxalase superfamily)